MPWYGKGYNGDEDLIIPTKTKRVTFIPIGQEHKYVEVNGEWFLKKDIEKLRDEQEAED